MLILPAAIASFTIATWLLLLLLCGGRALFGRLHAGWGRRALWLTLVSIPIHAFLTVPGVFGWIGSGSVATRRDERGYRGPILASDGRWLMQTRDSLDAEASGTSPKEANPYRLELRSSDGLALRAFLVPPLGSTRASVVLVHGLFRGAFELETVGAMFRDLGCEVLLLEYRNHGGSDRAAASFGPDESLDVSAAVDWLRSRAGEASRRPLVLFGVSMGTAAVVMAAARTQDLAAIVLDAPLGDALATAHRMLARGPGGRKAWAFPQPFRSLILISLETFSGIDLRDANPVAVLPRLGHVDRVLVIGGALDSRMPPEEVRSFFERLPQKESAKDLWIRAGADHGDVWRVDPDGYRSRLAALLDAVAPR
ncbi:MAG: alpha/beta hydrolase [Planctomycetota bacterium]